ncbi:MAG: hypothetical protein HFI75_11665 [Lachnospiraceae bacterium]|nr:hypothetical protein [Lachnospiraceae bacterium]
MSIIYDASKLKVFELLGQLCEYTNKTANWKETFWSGLLQDPHVYEEFLYYLEHHNLAGNYTIAGYSIIDLFVWQLDCYNLSADQGKIDARCNKEELILNAFYHMLKMRDHEEEYIKKFQNGLGNDHM